MVAPSLVGEMDMGPGCRMKHGICAVGAKQQAGCFYILVVEDARQASGNNEIVWAMTPPNG